jgi:hypothetical protein
MAITKITPKKDVLVTPRNQRELYLYAQEKLSAAMLKLAVGEGGVKSRLLWSFDSELCGLTVDFFPDALKDPWRKVVQNLTKSGSRNLNGTSATIRPVTNTLHKMRNATGSKIAENICDLKYRIDAYFEYPLDSL